MNLSIIAAMSNNNVIGANGKLPWYLPDDLAFFKQKTLGKSLVMGRRTFESIGKKLHKRRLIILTKNPSYSTTQGLVVHSLAEAIAVTKNEDEVIIGGGGEIYQQALELVNKMYLTIVHTNLQGDAYFPNFSTSNWEVISSKPHTTDKKHKYEFTFMELTRKKTV